MDPDENLRRQLEIVLEIQQLLDDYDPDSDDESTGFEEHQEMIAGLGEELAEHVQALHDWISKGGFLPKAWRCQQGSATDSSGA